MIQKRAPVPAYRTIVAAELLLILPDLSTAPMYILGLPVNGPTRPVQLDKRL